MQKSQRKREADEEMQEEWIKMMRLFFNRDQLLFIDEAGVVSLRAHPACAAACVCVCVHTRTQVLRITVAPPTPNPAARTCDAVQTERTYNRKRGP
jgi:hypothetical protein